MREMLDKFKYTEMTPVINIIGAMEKGRGKFYAGIARAAFNTDAVIVDNGLASGLEKFTLRRGVKLIGIAPEGEIKFPKINPSQVDGTELANGHTHLFLVSTLFTIKTIRTRTCAGEEKCSSKSTSVSASPREKSEPRVFPVARS